MRERERERERERDMRLLYHVYMNRKQYMEGPMTPSHLTLGDLERSKSRLLRFRSFVFCKGVEIDHMLLLNINRKAYTCTGSPLT